MRLLQGQGLYSQSLRGGFCCRSGLHCLCLPLHALQNQWLALRLWQDLALRKLRHELVYEDEGHHRLDHGDSCKSHDRATVSSVQKTRNKRDPFYRGANKAQNWQCPRTQYGPQVLISLSREDSEQSKEPTSAYHIFRPSCQASSCKLGKPVSPGKEQPKAASVQELSKL